MIAPAPRVAPFFHQARVCEEHVAQAFAGCDVSEKKISIFVDVLDVAVPDGAKHCKDCRPGPKIFLFCDLHWELAWWLEGLRLLAKAQQAER